MQTMFKLRCVCVCGGGGGKGEVWKIEPVLW